MKHIDSEVIKRLQDGDKKAFDRIYWQYSHKIYLNALKLTKDGNIAEDIVQEVFITLWEKRLSIDPSRPLLNWIFVISYHRSIDCLKRSLKTALAFDGVFPDIHPSDPDELSPREKQWMLIESAIKNLSPQKRKVFELCKLEGKTYVDAAKQLQISKHTVKEYLSAAMKNVKEFVQTSDPL